MPQITLTSPILGGDVGDTKSVTREQAKWATTNGYAVYTSDKAAQEKAVNPGIVSYTAEDDPTLSANREGPDEGKTPGVDDKTVSDTTKQGGNSGATQDRSGNASGTQESVKPLANSDATVEEVDALMAQEDEPDAETPDPAAGDASTPPADAGTATPDAEGKPTPKKAASKGS